MYEPLNLLPFMSKSDIIATGMVRESPTVATTGVINRTLFNQSQSDSADPTRPFNNKYNNTIPAGHSQVS